MAVLFKYDLKVEGLKLPSGGLSTEGNTGLWAPEHACASSALQGCMQLGVVGRADGGLKNLRSQSVSCLCDEEGLWDSKAANREET